MKGWAPAFRAELRDACAHPLVWLGLGACGLTAWAVGGLSEPKPNGYVVFESAARAGALVAGFFLVTIAALSVSSDRTRGTVRWIYPRAVSRIGVVCGKAAALAVLALCYFTVCLVAAYGVAAPFGFGDVVEQLEGFEGFGAIAEVDPEFAAEPMRARLWSASLLLLPALLAVTGLGLFVSCLFRSSAGAVIVALAATPPVFFVKEILGLGDEAARWMPYRAADEFLTHLGQYGRMFSTAEWPDYGVDTGAGALLLIVGLPLLGAFVFSRIDLTD